MNDQERFELCLNTASKIVDHYRSDCPLDYDPKAWFVSTTLAVVAVVAAMASAAGTYMSAQSQADAAKFNSAVARNNATAAAQQGQFDANLIAQHNERTLGQQKAAFAASGVDPSSGSAQYVRKASQQQGEMQRLMAIYTGRASATASQAQAEEQSAEAGMDMTAGYIGAGGQLLSGAASATAYYNNPQFQH